MTCLACVRVAERGAMDLPAIRRSLPLTSRPSRDRTLPDPVSSASTHSALIERDRATLVPRPAVAFRVSSGLDALGGVTLPRAGSTRAAYAFLAPGADSSPKPGTNLRAEVLAALRHTRPYGVSGNSHLGVHSAPSYARSVLLAFIGAGAAAQSRSRPSARRTRRRMIHARN